jgi:hypothetical protein
MVHTDILNATHVDVSPMVFLQNGDRKIEPLCFTPWRQQKCTSVSTMKKGAQRKAYFSQSG